MLLLRSQWERQPTEEIPHLHRERQLESCGTPPVTADFRKPTRVESTPESQGR